ncbi:MAG: VTT domain-containing protein [Elusimicrobia bacterium]|nr:VTT domain-containing protein [Elusimicrobiota bacterium]
MESVKSILHFVYDVQGLIQWGGLTLICAVVFVETGLFVGFFLPGDSLLVTAGVFSRMGLIPLAWLLPSVAACAILGDQLGYAIGRKTGQALFKREDGLFFKKKHLVRTHDFYEKYGAKTIVLARFVPIVRTFAPVVAGIASMNYARFVAYNISGGLLWVLSTVLGGYGLASLVPDIEKKIHAVILVVIFLSVLPGLIEFWRARRRA